MKKTIIAILLVCSLLCAFISCGEKSDELTLDDIVAHFDESTYYAQNYNSEQIDYIKEKLILEGDICAIVHITDQSIAASGNWVYIYELSDEADAVSIEKDRREFLKATDENGNIITADSSYEITGTTKLYAVYNGSKETVETAQTAINTFLSMTITQGNLLTAQAQYETVKTAIAALRANDYNKYISEDICESINVKVAEINTVAATSDDLYEQFSGVLHAEQAYTVSSNDGEQLLSLPQIDYSVFKKVTFTWNCSGWTFIGPNSANRWYNTGSALGGDATITYVDGKLQVAMTLTTGGTGSFTIENTDADVINGTKVLTLSYNCLVGSQKITIGNMVGFSVYDVWSVSSTTVISEEVSVRLPQGTATALNLPLVNYSLYENVTFDWSVSGWSQTGHKGDLWFYDFGSALGGTVTIVNNGDGTLSFTMTETVKGQGSHTKTITDSAIVNGQAALTLDAKSLVNTQTLTAGAMTATLDFDAKFAIAKENGKTPKTLSTTVNDAISVRCADSAGSSLMNLPLINYSLYEQVTFDWKIAGGWTFIGPDAANRWYNGGTALGGSVTITNNGNGTLTLTMTQTLDSANNGAFTLEITDAEIINGTKSLTLSYQCLVGTQKLVLSNFNAVA